MEIKAKVLGFNKGVTKAGNPSFKGFFQVADSDYKKVFFSEDPKDLVGISTLTITAWGNDASTFYDTLFSEKLLNKEVRLVGSMEKYQFNCCLILKI